MPKRSSKSSFVLDSPLANSTRKPVPHAFVLDAVASLSPYTRPMFGCLAVYVGEKIVFVLRDKPASAPDNGVWLATTCEHHENLRRDFPNMRSIQVFGKEVTGWQVLPVDAPDFEESAMRACEFVLAGDERIGKIPGARSSSKRAKTPAVKSKPAGRTAGSRKKH